MCLYLLSGCAFSISDTSVHETILVLFKMEKSIWVHSKSNRESGPFPHWFLDFEDMEHMNGFSAHTVNC